MASYTGECCKEELWPCTLGENDRRFIAGEAHPSSLLQYCCVPIVQGVSSSVEGSLLVIGIFLREVNFKWSHKVRLFIQSTFKSGELRVGANHQHRPNGFGVCFQF